MQEEYPVPEPDQIFSSNAPSSEPAFIPGQAGVQSAGTKKGGLKDPSPNQHQKRSDQNEVAGNCKKTKSKQNGQSSKAKKEADGEIDKKKAKVDLNKLEAEAEAGLENQNQGPDHEIFIPGSVMQIDTTAKALKGLKSGHVQNKAPSKSKPDIQKANPKSAGNQKGPAVQKISKKSSRNEQIKEQASTS